jgi:transposase-like protein
VVRNGHRKYTQYWLCRACNRGFVANNALVRGKIETAQIAAAVELFFQGLNPESIADELGRRFGYMPDSSTIWRWLIRYAEIAKKESERTVPAVGSTWLLDETPLAIAGGTRNLWALDIIDHKAQFLLATHIVEHLTIADIEGVMLEASKRAGRVLPARVVSEDWREFSEGIERAYGDGVEFRLGGLSNPGYRALQGRWRAAAGERAAVLQGLKNIKTARRMASGWLSNYNLFRAREGSETPALVAGLSCRYRSWSELIHGQAPASR